jgi:hypothetical protein
MNMRVKMRMIIMIIAKFQKILMIMSIVIKRKRKDIEKRKKRKKKYFLWKKNYLTQKI